MAGGVEQPWPEVLGSLESTLWVRSLLTRKEPSGGQTRPLQGCLGVGREGPWPGQAPKSRTSLAWSPGQTGRKHCAQGPGLPMGRYRGTWTPSPTRTS